MLISESSNVAVAFQRPGFYIQIKAWIIKAADTVNSVTFLLYFFL